MNTTRRWAGLRAAVLTLGVLAAAATAQAEPIVQYSSIGNVEAAGVSGTPVIGFSSILNNSFNAPSSFSLGDFQLAALPDGQTTTYANTPFNITFLVKAVDGNAPNPNETPIQLSGVLNGQVTGGGQSTVVADFNPVSTPTFQTGNFLNSLSIFDNPLSLVPSTTNSGLTTAQAFLTATAAAPVPEPTSVALFLTALGGLGLRRRLRGRKAS